MNETDRFRARLLCYWKENKMYFGLWLLLYLIPIYVYLVFVASVLPGLVDFLPVSEKKSLQGKAGPQFAASYPLAGALQSPAELASIEMMSS